MPLRSTVSQKMAESGVLSTQEVPKSLLEIELGSNRRKEDLDFLPHLPLSFVWALCWVDDVRCKSLPNRVVIEIEDPRYKIAAIEIEAPRCKSLLMTW